MTSRGPHHNNATLPRRALHTLVEGEDGIVYKKRPPRPAEIPALQADTELRISNIERTIKAYEQELTMLFGQRRYLDALQRKETFKQALGKLDEPQRSEKLIRKFKQDSKDAEIALRLA